MTMGNFTTIGAVEESTFGTTPSSALQLVNASGIKMPQNLKRERPNVLTGDRRRYPERTLQKSGEGLNLPMPLQYENDLLFMEGLMNNSRASAVTVTAVTIATTATTITDSGNGFGSFASGDLVEVSGFASGAANRIYGPIIKTSAGVLTVPTGQTPGVVAAGDSVTVRTRRLVDGSTLKSYSIEYQLTKLTTMFRSAKGQRVKQAKYSWQQGNFATAEYTFDGKVPAKASATIGTGAATAAKTSRFMNSVDDFQRFAIGAGGSGLGSMIVTKWDAMYANVLAPIYGLGNVGPQQIDVGPMDVSVDLSIYMDDNAKDALDASSAETTLWMWHSIVDPNGNKVAFLLPAGTLIVDDVPVNGAEDLVSIDAKFTAHDPAKDSSSTWYSNSFGFQAGIFFFPGS